MVEFENCEIVKINNPNGALSDAKIWEMKQSLIQIVREEELKDSLFQHFRKMCIVAPLVEGEVYDERHCQILSALCKRFIQLGCFVETEQFYNYYGQRGFTDLIAWGKTDVWFCEVKSRIVDFGEMLRQDEANRKIVPLTLNGGLENYKSISLIVVDDTLHNSLVLNMNKEQLTHRKVMLFTKEGLFKLLKFT